jgi:replication-associated recombination protein RarA
MTFGERITVGGYSCGEATSAMQKCIRRGLAEQALFWATELDLSGFGEYVWKRLKIITSEDVGPAEPSMPATIYALYQNWLAQLKKQEGEKHRSDRLFLVHAVLLLAAAKKSRVVDHAGIAMYEADRPKLQVPDFALDRHTSAGRKRCRGWKHFFGEGARLENRADIPDPFEKIARQTRQDNGKKGDLL